MASRGVRVAGFVLKTLFRVLWISTMVLTPLFGFWLASSLAAYKNASQLIALLVGLLLFPILPVGWDFFFLWRRKRKGVEVKAILLRIDRLVLRTLLINGLFLGVMLWRAPQTAFRAIAVRGDWILDGFDGPIANAIRSRLLGFADHFEQRWHKADDLHGVSDKAPEIDIDDAPPEVIYKPGQPHPGWPMSDEPDIQVTDMPADAQSSPEAVGKYLAARITDQKRLAKAIHDYVVLRMTYDEATFQLRGEERYTKRPSQKAEDVFVARTAVCEGYARLVVAIGEAAGIETAYITGYVRTSERRIDDSASEEAVKSVLEGYLHAWNAMKIDGTWVFVDATWDDPTGGTPRLESTYLFTPPTLFRMDHLPELPPWQLTTPISAGEFARQPLLSPYSGELGIVLESPTRSQVTVDDDAEILLDNPYGAEITAVAQRAGSTSRDVRCTVESAGGTKLAIECPLDNAGQYEVLMFGNPKGSTRASYEYFGTILVNRR